MRLKLFCLLLLSAVISPPLAAAEKAFPVLSQEDGRPAPAATLSDLEWLVGHWIGSGLGGTTEEIIAPAAAGQMPGMFRYIKDGKPGFYEFYLFAEVEGSVVLKLKHFNPDMTAWEEKDAYEAFPLVKLEDKTAYFDGLTYGIAADGKLHAIVDLGEGKLASFVFSRVTPEHP